MSGDLRGFHYALQPVLERQRWRTDALLAKVGVAQRAVGQAQVALDERERQLATLHQALADSRPGSVDPVLLRRSLHWLAGEREQIALQAKALEQLKAQRAEVLAEYHAQQAKLESLQEHRAGHQAEHVQDAQRRAAAEADNDWLARQASASRSAE